MIDPKKAMTAEEVIQFFSATQEFSVKREGENLRVSYTDDGNTTSSLIWDNPKALTIQQLIRKIQQLVWNHEHKIFD